METQIINGISTKLFETFGSDYTIYTENVEQFLKEPCFYIELISSNRKQFVTNRYKSDNSFDIHFFTSENEPKNEFRRIADILFDELEYIQLNDGALLRGINMHYEIVDDVLHFFVDYNLVLQKDSEQKDFMQNYETKIKMKG